MAYQFVRFAYTSTVASTERRLRRMLPNADIVNRGKSLIIDGVGINRTEVVVKNEETEKFSAMPQRSFTTQYSVIDMDKDGTTGMCVLVPHVRRDDVWHRVFEIGWPGLEMGASNLLNPRSQPPTTTGMLRLWVVHLDMQGAFKYIADLSANELSVSLYERSELAHYTNDTYNPEMKGKQCLVNNRGKVILIEGRSRGWVTIAKFNDEKNIVSHSSLSSAAQTMAWEGERYKVPVDPDDIMAFFYPEWRS